jgi:uncharacterized protein (DUF2225 family)
MTSLQPIDLVCPVCDNHFRSQSVVSTNSFGGKRTDFHERAAGAQPLPYLVHTCTACGFSGVERSFVEGSDVSPQVRSQVLTVLTPLVAEHQLDLPSERYHAAAQVAEWRGEHARHIADLLLRAAWCCVDDDDHEGERYFRRAAAHRFAEALSQHGEIPPPERAVLTYLVGELWRRVGDSALAAEWFARVDDEIVDVADQAWVVVAARQQRDAPREWFG